MKTQDKFDRYESILGKWSAHTNLVARATLSDIKTRHFADSAQLADILPKNANIIDLGSGAGFPAVVLAILGYNVTAIESIRKKTDFLNELKTELNLPNLSIYHGRVEDFIKTLKKAGKSRDFETVFTARAFAPLIKILDYVYVTKYRLFLLKGREIESEISTAKQKYKFDYELIPSKTGDGKIIMVDVRRQTADGKTTHDFIRN